MLVSTRGRYALCMLVDLAEHQTEGYIPLSDIAERQGISGKYLESILKSLVKARYLIGLRGKGGGYRLGVSPEQLTVADVLKLTEGCMAPVACMDECAQPCPVASTCRTLPMWQEFDRMANNFFSGITIADLMRSEAST